MYQEWGFSGSPFDVSSLPANAFGQRLLLGRQKPLAALKKRILNAPKLPVVEGLNGVGKTSLVNVASFELMEEHGNDDSKPLYIPCRQMFQLTPNPDVEKFVSTVFYAVAQTLIERSEEIKREGHYLRSAAIQKWLNDPQLNTWQAGIPIAQIGKSSEQNTGAGFEQSGFEKTVSDWLERIFPNAGGIICTIDNLELLQSSDAARDLLEALRDRLLRTKGLRWVLCGSLGITYGVASSPRIGSFLHEPLEIGEVDIAPADILKSRVDAYGVEGADPYIPLTEQSFLDLYNILQSNLRHVLDYTDRYCQYVADLDTQPMSDEDKDVTFNVWLFDITKRLHDAVVSEIRGRTKEVFKTACDAGGVFSPSEYETFGSNSVQALRPYIKALEVAGLLVSTQDETDKRRKTIQVTEKGWLVSFHLSRN